MQLLDQLVSYMRAASLKYGFLSTYKTTVFVRRIDKYRFGLSPPLDESSVNPSIRECFAGLCTLATIDGKFEGSDFNPALVTYPVPFNQASNNRMSSYVLQVSHYSKLPPGDLDTVISPAL